ncbi:hypothetical protein GGS20DRAFT_426988 [Poronia punctata]|nr:hypothetical protein GGS20DRAFT_426988 [Poronia punctata]
MAELTPSFAAFWAFLHNNFEANHVNRAMDGLHYSLLEELENPFAVGYTPNHLAYRVIHHSMSHACPYPSDLATLDHLTVPNAPRPGEQPIDVQGLKYLVQAGHKGRELLLDIFEGGQTAIRRRNLSIALTSAKAPKIPVARSATMTAHKPGGKGNQQLSSKPAPRGHDVDEIPIPAVIDIRRDVQPYLPEMQSPMTVRLGISMVRYSLLVRRQEKIASTAVDDMVSDRHRQEFRYLFLLYTKECLESDQSFSVKDFFMANYKGETANTHESIKGLTMYIKQEYGWAE